MPRDLKGDSAFTFIVLFGDIVAIMIGAILAAFYVQQLDVRVGLQAQSLADELAKTSVSSLGGGQPTLGLPTDVGGSEYRISIEDDRTFVVEITAGGLKGNRYTSRVGVDLRLGNAGFTPGGKVYFQRSGTEIIVSSTPIEREPPRNIEISGTPPEFYHFAKWNPRKAMAIAAGYFYALDDYENIEAKGYTLEGDNVLVQIGFKGGENLFGVRVSGYENPNPVEHVINAWVWTGVQKLPDNLTNPTACPSIENAWRNGWFYSRSQVLIYLRSRTWRQTSDNFTVTIPSDASVWASAATTNVSTYPTWRIEFEGRVLHYRAMPWWWAENVPGFVFQSEPKLEPLI